ncbi:MAG: CPBP family intramembrane glutamic endopeptidase [Bacteroidales bacterium]|jgi:membrane protease YdiL (CAAX protease family)
MKNSQRLVLGLAATGLIFCIAVLATRVIPLHIDFFPESFITHSVMLLLSLLVIAAFKKNLGFAVSMPYPPSCGKPILFGLLTTVVVNVVLALAIQVGGIAPEAHPALAKNTFLQTFLFIFIYASLAEELLVRGFLQNLLAPLRSVNIQVFKRTLSLPVIISAVVFGLLHLILLTSEVSGFFVFRIVVFTTVLGLVAGYYQEKYNNFAYAVLVHMAGNLPGLLFMLVGAGQ